MRSGNDQLRTSRILVDLEQEHLDPLAGSISLGRHLLARRHHRLGLAELDDDGAGIGALDDAVDDLALPIGELLVDGIALVVANALEHDLLGGLRGDAAEVLRRPLNPQRVADFRCRQVGDRFWQEHVIEWILDLVDNVLDADKPGSSRCWRRS